MTRLASGDRGQRYVVRYCDAAGVERDFGYAGTEQGAAIMVESIDLHPTMMAARVRDRQAGLELDLDRLRAIAAAL